MEWIGLWQYALVFGSLCGVYAILALGLSIHWGWTGILNLGVGGFFALGAYVSAIVTAPPSPLGGVFGWNLPITVGVLLAVVISVLLALVVGLITLRMRADYLAITSIGLAEILRMVLKNETDLTGGSRGILNIPRPWQAWGLVDNASTAVATLLGVVAVTLVVRHLRRSRFALVLRATREHEIAASVLGKRVLRLRLQSFVLGSSMMSVAGSLYAHFIGFVSPDAFEPLFATLLVWAMITIGGSATMLGPLVGAVVVWGIWSMSGVAVGLLADSTAATQFGAIRFLLIGLVLQVCLVKRPEGLFPEKPVFTQPPSRPDASAGQDSANTPAQP